MPGNHSSEGYERLTLCPNYIATIGLPPPTPGTSSAHPLKIRLGSRSGSSRTRVPKRPMPKRPTKVADQRLQPHQVSMKSLTRYLTFRVAKRMDFINITPDVEQIVAESGVQEGLVLCNAMHITASVFINDDEPGLHHDFKKWLEELAPFDRTTDRYHHNRTGEDNADAHHKRQIMGREVIVAITAGQLDFGPWEQIFYGEFDGRRPKRVLVKVIGE
jgi:secondary thiamine-phosphate synthase enzyme